MQTEIEVAAPAAEEEEDFTVIANKPEEMAQAQASLVAWASRALSKAQETLAEREALLLSAKTAKIRTSPWTKLVGEARSATEYYEKMLAALRAGYFIVPEFPMSIIAVRTTRSRAPAKTGESWQARQLAVVDVASPPAGEGKYVAPALEFYTTERGTEGNKRHIFQTTGFKPVDMPMRLVKPRILQELDRALQERVFDEIGILPLIKPGKAPTRPPDPMLFGRIHRRQGTRRVTATFLITWWLDTSTL